MFASNKLTLDSARPANELGLGLPRFLMITNRVQKAGAICRAERFRPRSSCLQSSFLLTLSDLFFSFSIAIFVSCCDCHALAWDQNGPEGCEMMLRNPPNRLRAESQESGVGPASTYLAVSCALISSSEEHCADRVSIFGTSKNRECHIDSGQSESGVLVS
ncbi:uncharacterized protein BDW70DRAFT_122807 [Aspergillus foveolatus]|uniref:uncharacterized protein n=1 Tax=Aspergillus foveolatus TaxID=210207 RepID=UPI003CCCAC05